MSTSIALPPGLAETIGALRRDLHRHPELAFEEHHTASRLAESLQAIPGVSVDRVAGTALVGRVRGRSGAGPVIAIRGDIDALPIQEATGVSWASERPGVMHACGHDVHAAWTVGAAHLIAADPPDHDVLFVLQPAEETARGALAVLETGCLDAVAAIVGAHVDVRFPVGTVVAEPGPIAGSTDEFRVEVIGRGGHAARPHETHDPIIAAAAIVVALQAIVSRRLPPGEPGVVTVGMIQSGTAPNVIPDRAVLSGTLRAVHAETRAVLQRELTQTAEAVAAAHNVDAHVVVTPGTPPIVNAAGPIAWARDAVTDLLGPEALVSLPAVNLGGEDFAFYLERMPGCFLRIGAGGAGEPIAAHTARFLPEEGALVIGAAVLAETARRAGAAIARR